MTNLEAVKASVGANYPLMENTYAKALIDAGLEPDELYTKENVKDADLCAADLILALLTSADIREGGYQVSVNDKATLLKVRTNLLAKHGVPDYTRPRISARPTNLW